MSADRAEGQIGKRQWKERRKGEREGWRQGKKGSGSGWQRRKRKNGRFKIKGNKWNKREVSGEVCEEPAGQEGLG